MAGGAPPGDTLRDVRGFGGKFYTKEGKWGLVSCTINESFCDFEDYRPDKIDEGRQDDMFTQKRIDAYDGTVSKIDLSHEKQDLDGATVIRLIAKGEEKRVKATFKQPGIVPEPEANKAGAKF